VSPDPVAEVNERMIHKVARALEVKFLSNLFLYHPDTATPHSPKTKQNTTKVDQQSMSASDPWFSGVGAFVAAVAHHSASGDTEIVELYKIYIEKRPCSSSERIGRLLGYIASIVASILIGGWVIGATWLSSDRRPELVYIGLLFMVMMFIILIRGHRGGSEPTWISTAFIWLVRFCLGGADASNH
jgi:Na+-transporting NADH:ubiquinone oxidoreductase subunit NqrB